MPNMSAPKTKYNSLLGIGTARSVSMQENHSRTDDGGKHHS